jgi:hypothetical protein
MQLHALPYFHFISPDPAKPNKCKKIIPFFSNYSETEFSSGKKFEMRKIKNKMSERRLSYFGIKTFPTFLFFNYFFSFHLPPEIDNFTIFVFQQKFPIILLTKGLKIMPFYYYLRKETQKNKS